MIKKGLLGIVGVIVVPKFWIPGGLCLIIGALLAFLSRKHTP